MEKIMNTLGLAVVWVLARSPYWEQRKLVYEKEIVPKFWVVMAAHNTELLFYTAYILYDWILFTWYYVGRYV